ncbi:MAG: twin-arginine translocation signal domain-containing protein [Clostridiales bacterium]|nr:twin-arginine translocation signal domain-containing protein [Clostridiales bacterium]
MNTMKYHSEKRQRRQLLKRVAAGVVAVLLILSVVAVPVISYF